MKIFLVGTNGAMGQAINNLCKKTEDVSILAGMDLEDKNLYSYPIYTNIQDIPKDLDFDVIIDFSHPAFCAQTVNLARQHKKPLVYATTGLNDEDIKLLDELSKEVALFRSSNMSLGVNLVINLAKQAAKFLYDDFDIEIIEKHHNKKIDAPSGTALTMAKEINKTLDNKMNFVYERESKREKRDKKEIGIHSIRGGTIVGEHDILFAGNDETITLSHQATSKEVFAKGALRAGQFIKDLSPGLYGMNNLLASVD